MQLQDWFEEKDYGVGLAILGNHSKNRMLLQNLGRKANPEKLEYELKKIAISQGLIADAEEGIKELIPNLPEPLQDESHSDQVIDQMNAGNGKTMVRPGIVINPDELPDALRARWHENNDLYKEIRSIHEKLKLMENASDDDRAPLVVSIDANAEKIRTNWEAIDAWKPGDAQIIETVLELDHKRINANRKFISTNLQTLKGMTVGDKSEKIRAKIQERYDELKNAGEAVQSETIDELTKAGIQC